MRHVLVELSFKVHRGFEAERAVEPRAVVKGFDPLEDGRARVGARGKPAAMDQPGSGGQVPAQPIESGSDETSVRRGGHSSHQQAGC